MQTPASPFGHSIAAGASDAYLGANMAPRDRSTSVTLRLLCQVAHSLTFVSMALFLPLIREELHISYAQAGTLAAAATLSYALGQIPAGLLTDRFTPRRLFLIGLIGWSLLSIVLGLTQVFWWAVVNQFIAGAFRALSA